MVRPIHAPCARNESNNTAIWTFALRDAGCCPQGNDFKTGGDGCCAIFSLRCNFGGDHCRFPCASALPPKHDATVATVPQPSAVSVLILPLTLKTLIKVRVDLRYQHSRAQCLSRLYGLMCLSCITERVLVIDVRVYDAVLNCLEKVSCSPFQI